LLNLERLASGEAVAQAVLRALYTLQFMAPPELAQQAQRSLRKLQFSGARFTPPAPEGWRALLSPADARGNQSIWLIRMPGSRDKTGVLIGLVVNGRAGILYGFGSDTIAREHLPLPTTIGRMALVKTDSGETAIMLETPFDYGRWRVQTALHAHWSQTPPPPMPGEFMLYGDLLWEFGAPQVDEPLRIFFEPHPPLPKKESSAAELDAAAAKLLRHPVMAAWTLQYQALHSIVKPQAKLSEAQFAARILQEIENRPESALLSAGLEEGLRAQSAWLYLAGDHDSAQAALLLAEHVPHLPLTQNPLLAHLLEASLLATPNK
jgi:hypothetical protein